MESRKKNITQAVEELIDPCNILIPMTINGEYGFGHLRFQEYLAATELVSNRGIDVNPLMKQSWWRDTLVLFSQLTDNIEFIINSLVTAGPIAEMVPIHDRNAQSQT